MLSNMLWQINLSICEFEMKTILHPLRKLKLMHFWVEGFLQETYMVERHVCVPKGVRMNVREEIVLPQGKNNESLVGKVYFP